MQFRRSSLSINDTLFYFFQEHCSSTQYFFIFFIVYNKPIKKGPVKLQDGPLISLQPRHYVDDTVADIKRKNRSERN